ncbi:MerR family transcriptional regulator [Paenibacillus gorillae]|uniref:MerR family transcriptional regulator n=1 Tax=Paenibacillus gorillae TaxID=1243662 RepID=UPI0004B9E286|nr:MerR family transcriptional regulator [Paenibacillus gorillae]
MEGITRGELAKLSGVSKAAIRYYEESGILPAPQRAANGYRMYSNDYVVKLIFIKDAQSLGYSLKEIQDGLQIVSTDMEEEALKELVRNKISEIGEKIETLQAMQSMLAGLLQTPANEIKDYMRLFRIKDEQIHE